MLVQCNWVGRVLGKVMATATNCPILRHPKNTLSIAYKIGKYYGAVPLMFGVAVGLLLNSWSGTWHGCKPSNTAKIDG